MLHDCASFRTKWFKTINICTPFHSSPLFVPSWSGWFVMEQEFTKDGEAPRGTLAVLIPAQVWSQTNFFSNFHCNDTQTGKNCSELMSSIKTASCLGPSRASAYVQIISRVRNLTRHTGKSKLWMNSLRLFHVDVRWKLVTLCSLNE